jgi:hypothetical protein
LVSAVHSAELEGGDCSAAGFLSSLDSSIDRTLVGLFLFFSQAAFFASSGLLGCCSFFLGCSSSSALS